MGFLTHSILFSSKEVKFLAKIKCTSCGKLQDERREYYATNSDLYNDTGRLTLCKSCIDHRFNKTYEKLKDDKLAAKKLFQLLDVYFDDDLYETCKNKTRWLGEYMRIINSNVRYKNLSSLDNGYVEEVVEISEVNDDTKSNIQIPNKIVRKWGKGFDYDDYQFLEDKFKEFTSTYECRTPAQKTIFEQICKCLLRSEKAFVEGDANKIDKLNNSLSRLMADGNIKPIQEASVSDDDAMSIGKWINRIEQERPIGEPCEQFKDVDGIIKYITKWFTKQMYKVFDVDSEVDDDVN